MILRCYVYSISQDKIINYNYPVETDNLPLAGLDPDLKVYGEHIPFPEPPFDSRGWNLIITNTMKESAHPTYPDLLTYEITYTTERLTDEQLYSSVDTMETYSNELLAPTISYGGKRQRYNGIIHRKTNGTNPTTKEDSFLLEMDNIADAMDNNSDNADSMKDYIDNNPTLVPDFDAGWTTEIV